ncbi:MAG: SAM-dependent methyltransferase, partial [Wolbachia pipientis]|nr:SAM-dependent methyltransferase [Wolbachia pipientis]
TWEKLGKPPKFSLVELGPGRGTLIYDILRVTKKYRDFFRSVNVYLIEISPILRKIQEEKLKELSIHWRVDISNLPDQPTIFIANEFFDALPMDQFIYYSGKWYEKRIAKQNNEMFFQSLITKIQEKKLYILMSAAQVINGKFFDGAVVEVCLAGIEVLKKLEKKIVSNKGAAIIIDYGYVYPTYKSTLQSVGQHNYSSFLENVGNNDITALVNFQALKSSLRYVNCEILTQREFLYLFGIKERVQALINNVNGKQRNKIFNEFLRLTENMGTLFKVMLINS